MNTFFSGYSYKGYLSDKQPVGDDAQESADKTRAEISKIIAKIETSLSLENPDFKMFDENRQALNAYAKKGFEMAYQAYQDILVRVNPAIRNFIHDSAVYDVRSKILDDSFSIREHVFKRHIQHQLKQLEEAKLAEQEQPLEETITPAAPAA